MQSGQLLQAGTPAAREGTGEQQPHHRTETEGRLRSGRRRRCGEDVEKDRGEGRAMDGLGLGDKTISNRDYDIIYAVVILTRYWRCIQTAQKLIDSNQPVSQTAVLATRHRTRTFLTAKLPLCCWGEIKSNVENEKRENSWKWGAKRCGRWCRTRFFTSASL